MRGSFTNNHVPSTHVPFTQSKLPFEITGAFFGYLGYEVGHEAINILTGTSSSSHPSAGCYDLSTPSHSSAVFGRDMNADEDSSTPLALLLYPSRYIVYDHESSTYHTVSFVESSSRGGNNSRNNSNNNNNNNNTFLQEEATRLGEELADRLEAIIGMKRTSCEELKGRSTKATVAAVAVAKQSSRLVAWKSKAAYKNDIATCLENIASGETYEVCLTLQFTGPLRQQQSIDRSTSSRYIDTYKDLRKYNPAPYACFIQYKSPRIRIGGIGASDDHRSVAMPVDANSFAICCTSPECFLKLTPVSHRYHHLQHHPQSRHTVLSRTL
jgi:anthranilate/para-aminobenzoate synthase component I